MAGFLGGQIPSHLKRNESTPSIDLQRLIVSFIKTAFGPPESAEYGAKSTRIRHDKDLRKILRVVKSTSETKLTISLETSSRTFYAWTFKGACGVLLLTESSDPRQESPERPVLYLQQNLRGRRGNGQVDISGYSRKTRDYTLDVMEVKRDGFRQGVAQDIVQLESVLVEKKRKRKKNDIDEEEEPSRKQRAYEILTNSETRLFLECTLDEDETVSYRMIRKRQLFVLYDNINQAFEGSSPTQNQAELVYERDVRNRDKSGDEGPFRGLAYSDIFMDPATNHISEISLEQDLKMQQGLNMKQDGAQTTVKEMKENIEVADTRTNARTSEVSSEQELADAAGIEHEAGCSRG
ncbi:MAG: hypothetical protein J3R72DRAFT_490831 [Linnemannia gamsii]|nr:MAG: hypothetical protein J3R72DRAFT_490831 [Linnemannia gamsii]